MEEARPAGPLHIDEEGALLPGVTKTEALRWAEEDGPRASPGQAAGHGVRPWHGHKVHGTQQQRAHLLVLLERLAQVLQLLRQFADLSPQHRVFLLQALVFLGRTGNGHSHFCETGSSSVLLADPAHALLGKRSH